MIRQESGYSKQNGDAWPQKSRSQDPNAAFPGLLRI